jgi:hypothetical protein
VTACGHQLTQVEQGRAVRPVGCDFDDRVILIFRQPQHLCRYLARRWQLGAVHIDDREPPEHREDLLPLTQELAKLESSLIGRPSFGRRPSLCVQQRATKGQLQIEFLSIALSGAR